MGPQLWLRHTASVVLGSALALAACKPKPQQASSDKAIVSHDRDEAATLVFVRRNTASLTDTSPAGEVTRAEASRLVLALAVCHEKEGARAKGAKTAADAAAALEALPSFVKVDDALPPARPQATAPGSALADGEAAPAVAAPTPTPAAGAAATAKTTAAAPTATPINLSVQRVHLVTALYDGNTLLSPDGGPIADALGDGFDDVECTLRGDHVGGAALVDAFAHEPKDQDAFDVQQMLYLMARGPISAKRLPVMRLAFQQFVLESLRGTTEPERMFDAQEDADSFYNPCDTRHAAQLAEKKIRKDATFETFCDEDGNYVLKKDVQLSERLALLLQRVHDANVRVAHLVEEQDPSAATLMRLSISEDGGSDLDEAAKAVAQGRYLERLAKAAKEGGTVDPMLAVLDKDALGAGHIFAFRMGTVPLGTVAITHPAKAERAGLALGQFVNGYYYPSYPGYSSTQPGFGLSGGTLGTLGALAALTTSGSLFGRSSYPFGLSNTSVPYPSSLFGNQLLTGTPYANGSLFGNGLASNPLLAAGGGYTNPAYGNLGYANPAYANPAYGNLGYANPAYANLGYANPAYSSLGYGNLGASGLSNAAAQLAYRNWLATGGAGGGANPSLNTNAIDPYTLQAIRSGNPLVSGYSPYGNYPSSYASALNNLYGANTYAAPDGWRDYDQWMGSYRSMSLTDASRLQAKQRFYSQLLSTPSDAFLRTSNGLLASSSGLSLRATPKPISCTCDVGAASGTCDVTCPSLTQTFTPKEGYDCASACVNVLKATKTNPDYFRTYQDI
jgi:hypothetical protein